MRVQVIEKIVHSEGSRTAGPTAQESALPIKNFLAAMESDDSLFQIGQPLAVAFLVPSGQECECLGEVIIEFRAAEQRAKRSLHFQLVEKLVELLKAAGSQEKLEARLCLTTAAIPLGSPQHRDARLNGELGLWLQLNAKGATKDQAELRWGLGLSHLQQALLFTSRHLRQFISSPGG
ncbi:MAG TPA: hypothetical protein VJN93_15240 [Candidatus Acidoferrum sp.]|nr:hypothetical protein [Candidatus Acidoferrum sp.]